MKRRRVLFAETARDQVRAAKSWWMENDLPVEILAEEIEEAIALLSLLPGAGSLYPDASVPGLRRLYLRRISSHLYYTFTDNAVMIRALWHAKRGQGPNLGG